MYKQIPTQEQTKEFWERYGFYQSEYEFIDWCTPDGKICDHIGLDFPPTVNLDNLFEYAVLRALEVITTQGYCPPIMKLFQLWYDELVTIAGDSGNVQYATLALFRVLDKIRERSLSDA